MMLKPINAREALVRRYRRFRKLVAELHDRKTAGRPVPGGLLENAFEEAKRLERELKNPVIESRRAPTAMYRKVPRKVQHITEKLASIPDAGGGMR